MTPAQLFYMVRGMMADTSLTADQLGAQLVAAVAGMLPDKPARAIPPQLQHVMLRAFCIHNVSVSEDCPVCAQRTATSFRLFALALPKATKMVYIRLGHQEGGSDGGLRADNGDAGAGRAHGQAQHDDTAISQGEGRKE
jgi:hypothetical protein